MSKGKDNEKLGSLRTGIFILARLLSTGTIHPGNPHGFTNGRIYKFQKGEVMWFIFHKGKIVDLVYGSDIQLTRVLPTKPMTSKY